MYCNPQSSPMGMAVHSWVRDEGDLSPSCEMSEMAEIIRLMLSVRAGLKLSDFINLLSEKTSEEFARMK